MKGISYAVDGDYAPTAELETEVTNDDNDDALTEVIDLNESLEMEKLLEENEGEEDTNRDGQDFDTYHNCLIEKDVNIQEVEEEITHTANIVSNMNDTQLGQLSDKKGYTVKFHSRSIEKEYTLKQQFESKTEYSSTDNTFYMEEPARKKLKLKNIEQITLSVNISQEKPDDTMEGQALSKQCEEEPKLEKVCDSAHLAGMKVNIKTEPEEVVGPEGSVTVYCCPLDRCSFTTSREGMRNNSAATHLRSLSSLFLQNRFFIHVLFQAGA